MTQSHADITDAIRQAITDTAASSPMYDSDTLADVIANAVDPAPPSTDIGPDPHEIADGHGTIVYPETDTAGTSSPEPAASDETAHSA